MQASRKFKITLLFLILVLLGFIVIYRDDWRSSRQLAIARRALRDRDADTALDATRQAAQMTPRNGEVHFLMARAYRRQGQLDKVHESLERAAKFGVARDRIQREEWLAMAQAGQMKEAQPHLGELLINPGDDGPEICEAYVNGFFLTYQLAAAFAILDGWEKDFPSDAQPHVFRSIFSSKTSNWSATVKHLRRALELAPNRNDVRIELAMTLLLMQELDEASKLLEQLRRTQPDDPEVLVGCAQIQRHHGQIDQARSTLDRVLRTHPQHVIALRLIGEIDMSAGHLPEAIQRLEEAVAIKSNDLEAHYALATALQKAGRDDAARQHFEFVTKGNKTKQRVEQLIVKVSMKNDDVESRFEIAELLSVTGEIRDRLLWLRSVTALDPEHKAAHAELAKCYAELGNLEESRKHSRLAEAN